MSQNQTIVGLKGGTVEMVFINPEDSQNQTIVGLKEKTVYKNQRKTWMLESDYCRIERQYAILL